MLNILITREQFAAIEDSLYSQAIEVKQTWNYDMILEFEDGSSAMISEEDICIFGKNTILIACLFLLDAIYSL